MKKIFILFVLLVLPTVTYAEFIYFDKTNSGDEWSIDHSSIMKKNNFSRMWTMLNYKNIQPTGTMSDKVYEEYDCGEKKFRYLSYIAYSERNGKGDVLYKSDKITNWTFIAPQTTRDNMYKIACNKK